MILKPENSLLHNSNHAHSSEPLLYNLLQSNKKKKNNLDTNFKHQWHKMCKKKNFKKQFGVGNVKCKLILEKN